MEHAKSPGIRQWRQPVFVKVALVVLMLAGGVSLPLQTRLGGSNSRTLVAPADQRASSSAQRCIELAAGWREMGPEIEFDAIDPQQAIPACQAAVKEYPKQPDLKAHLCRALRKAERFDEAIGFCRQAAEAGSAAGQVQLGWAYQYGQAVPQSDMQAITWYRQAARQGLWHGYLNLGKLLAHSQPKAALEPLQQALTLARQAGYRRGEGLVLWNLGDAHEASDHYPEALGSVDISPQPNEG